jgi:predicted acyl esterase
LTLPEGAGPFPAAILVSGSGPQDRDETILEHKPFHVLADHLTQAGIAVLRYDDRGVAESGGKFSTATSEDFTGDALAAFAYLQGRAEIAPGRVGIIGHSSLDRGSTANRFFTHKDSCCSRRRALMKRLWPANAWCKRP